MPKGASIVRYRHMEGNYGDRGMSRASFAPVKVGDELDVTIEAVGEKGDGLAKKKGFVLFVPNTKANDNVRIRITKVLRKVGFAEVVKELDGPPPKDEEDEAEQQGSEDSGEYGEQAKEAAPEDSESFGEEESDTEVDKMTDEEQKETSEESEEKTEETQEEQKSEETKEEQKSEDT